MNLLKRGLWSPAPEGFLNFRQIATAADVDTTVAIQHVYQPWVSKSPEGTTDINRLCLPTDRAWEYVLLLRSLPESKWTYGPAPDLPKAREAYMLRIGYEAFREVCNAEPRMDSNRERRAVDRRLLDRHAKAFDAQFSKRRNRERRQSRANLERLLASYWSVDPPHNKRFFEAAGWRASEPERYAERRAGIERAMQRSGVRFIGIKDPRSYDETNTGEPSEQRVFSALHPDDARKVLDALKAEGDEVAKQEFMNFREIAQAARKRAGTRHPSTSSIANGLLWQGRETSQVPTEFGALAWTDLSSETGSDDDRLSLPKHIADKWVDNLATHWKAIKERDREYREEKRRKLNLFPKREAHMRRVGYDRMSREWWAERRDDQNYTPDVARRRDVDNQILAKYQSRKDEFPGKSDAPAYVPPKPLPERSYSLSWRKGWNFFWVPRFDGRTPQPEQIHKLRMRGDQLIRAHGDHDWITEAPIRLNGIYVLFVSRRRYCEALVTANQARLIRSGKP